VREVQELGLKIERGQLGEKCKIAEQPQTPQDARDSGTIRLDVQRKQAQEWKGGGNGWNFPPHLGGSGSTGRPQL
jgi:hypothetical protein